MAEHIPASGPTPIVPQYGPQPPAVAVAPPVAYQQPAPQPEPTKERDKPPTEVILISHSPLVYWWPVWVIGYVMAGLTWWYGQPLQFGEGVVKVHPASSIGVLFFLILFLVIVISNINVRGYASGMVVMGIITISVVLAYFNMWGGILGWFGDLNVYLNQGAYFWFSTLLLLVWAGTVFGVDRFTHWKVTPGQITKVALFGSGSKSYDTENMVLEKRRDDLFRHWILGLGSGDLRIHTYGGKSQELFIPNILFMGSKISTVQQMISMQPGKFSQAAIE